MKKVLHLAIDSLFENQRTAFTLSKFDDLSYYEEMVAEVKSEQSEWDMKKDKD